MVTLLSTRGHDELSYMRTNTIFYTLSVVVSCCWPAAQCISRHGNVTNQPSRLVQCSLDQSHIMEPVEHKLLQKLRDVSSLKEYVKVAPTGTIMPKTYEEWKSNIDHFQVRPDDVWVVTPPKSGTTWTQEMVWCMLFGMNSEEVKLPLSRRFPFLEYDSILSGINRDVTQMSKEDPRRPGKSWEYLQNLPSPRTIKSHLPYPLLPKQMSTVKPKIITVCRDPRDMCVSYYYHFLRLDGAGGSFEDFAELFVNDLLLHLPYWETVLDFWRRRDEENILFLRYEEMKEDLASVVKRVATFLEKELTGEEVTGLVEHCSFDVMKNNSAVNKKSIPPRHPSEKNKGLEFFRKGVVGDWRNHLTESQQRAFKEWTFRNLDGSDFPYYQDYV